MVKSGRQAPARDLGARPSPRSASCLEGVGGDQIGAIVGDLSDCEAMVVLKDLMMGLDIAATRLPPERLPGSTQGALRAISSTPRIAGIEQADLCVLVGSNPRDRGPA